MTREKREKRNWHCWSVETCEVSGRPRLEARSSPCLALEAFDPSWRPVLRRAAGAAGVPLLAEGADVGQTSLSTAAEHD